LTLTLNPASLILAIGLGLNIVLSRSIVTSCPPVWFSHIWR
jgi:hypothetical protein